jgi:outer membrane protein OmpA-like peptidoglycan-associated protein
MESPLSFDSTENFRKKLLLKNLKPYKVDGFYSPAEKTTNKEFSLVDYSVIDTIPLDNTAKLIENTLIGQNKYTPETDGFGNMVSINVNKGTQTNNGVYEYSKTFFSTLENFGKNKEIELMVQNQYGPEGQQSKTTITPNLNFQTKSNEGNYGYTDSIRSTLETKGNELERFLRVLNKYGPEKQGGQYGDSVLFELKTLGTNTGEYRDQKDAQGSLLETEGQLQEIILYTKNKYGPAVRGSKSYGSVVPINDEFSLGSNYGEYIPNESSGIDSELQILGEQNLVILLNNVYQPNNPTEVTPNDNIQQKPSKGEFIYETSIPGRSTQESQSLVYAKNKYNNGEGGYEDLTIDDLTTETINSPYLLSDTTFAFIPSDYLPISILTTDKVENISGSDGKLSQDSSLAQIGAKRLQKEFKARVAFELLQQTLGRSTLTNSTITPDSGGISVNPKLNPFDVLGVLSNKLPIIQRDYKITSASNNDIESVGFVGRLSGLYSPYSIIPNQYFDYPNRNFLSQSVDNPVGSVLGLVNNLVNSITSPFIDSASELFIANTSPAVRGLLFDQLFYNNYRPDYLLSSLQSPNLLAPKGNYYVGSTKNFIRDAVSPKTDLPKGIFGKANIGPVFGYSEIAKEYEGPKLSEQLFGISSKPYYDGVGSQGGFTWLAKDNLYVPGKFVGPGNKQINGKSDTVFEQSSFGPEYNKSKSTNFDLTEGSILDATQKLVQAANNSTRRSEHVGNAINQVSKVFKDGLMEMTKGSKVIRYTTPTSVDPSQAIMGYEYCRLFTKDRPYLTYNELQKKDGNIRNFSYSVLDKTYNLNIAPMGSKDNLGSSNITNEGKVKKYMFSIENLAWKTSNKSGYRVDDLPACEVGPNGGRIMWFPPYDLKYDDSSTARWTPVDFLGRPEPIYIYKNSERSGGLSFKIVVDHPSILNLIVNKELEKENNSESTKIIDSFFAGCLKYDPITLLKKYRQFSLSDVFEATEALNSRQELKKVINEIPNTQTTGQKTTTTGDITGSENQTSNTSVITDLQKGSEKGGIFEEIILLFDQSIPAETSLGGGLESDKDYTTLYGTFIGNKTSYINSVTTNNTFPDGSYIKYGTTNSLNTLPSSVTEETAGSEYIIFKKSSLENLYTDIVKEKSDFDDFLNKIATALKSNATVSFTIVSSANANGTVEYNEKLSSRRYDSVLKTILSKDDGDGATLKKYYENNKLNIKPDPQGKKSILKTSKYSNIDCSKEFNNTNTDGKASIQAMLCRRVTITELKVTPEETIPEEQKSTSKETEKPSETLPNPKAAESTNVDNTTPQYVTTNSSNRLTGANAKTAGLTKKLLRKLLSECSYFEMLQEQQPMVYDGIKSKIKNFSPTFHSMTPEGLNSRLTFLNQCVRPGDTIPTVVSDGNRTALQYNDVFNSAFGTPPVCVIRVGDFYHTKAIIETVKFDYNEARFDLNPEGIGVQPMIVDVTLGLKFIGGHGLKGPVATLQNALSFNYYANTEMYDERAEETVTDKYTKLDAELLEDIKNEYGILDGKRNEGNDAGNTIGTILTNFVDPTTSAITGTIQYKDVMKTLTNVSGEYFNTIFNNFEKIKNETLIGGIILYNSEKKYTQGRFNWLSGNTTNVVNIFGKPFSFSDRVDTIINQAKEDVDNEKSPILGGLSLAGFDNSDIRKIKRKIKELIDGKSNGLKNALSSAQTNIIKNEVSLIKITDRLNYVSDKVDGYINNRGGVVIFDLSGTTNGTTNTFDELVTDFLKVGTDLNTYNQKLDEFKIVPTGTSYTYNTDLKFEMYLKPDNNSAKGYETVSKQVNVFFMVFGKEILDDYVKFIDSVASVIPISSMPPFEEIRDTWKKFLFSNLGFTYDYNVNEITKRTSGLYQDFERSKTKTDEIFKKFKDDFLNGFIPNNTYTPFQEKERIMDYQKQNPVIPPYDENLRDLTSKNDVNWDYFNLKKTLN